MEPKLRILFVNVKKIAARNRRRAFVRAAGGAAARGKISIKA
ncbi:hypothetical protein [uncultured Alistipes sp.]|jgi:hypothetical protein|nr:hypothetical protein [uncultured Alistipes sp.]